MYKQHFWISFGEGRDFCYWLLSRFHRALPLINSITKPRLYIKSTSSYTTVKTSSLLRAHLGRVDSLVQELLQRKHLAARGCRLPDLTRRGGGFQGVPRGSGALAGRAGRRRLLDGTAAAAGPGLLLQTQAELAAALAVRTTCAAVERAWWGRTTYARCDYGLGFIDYDRVKNNEDAVIMWIKLTQMTLA